MIRSTSTSTSTPAPRRTLITGAAGGIGQVLVARFLAEGDEVLAQDRDAAGLAQLKARHATGLTTLQADLLQEGALHAALAKVLPAPARVDVLIANAGWSQAETLHGMSRATWRAEIDNLHVGHESVQAVLEGMCAQRAGAIVFIGSVNALLALGNPAYSAAKAGLISYCKSLAMEYGQYRIRSNIVLPGTVKTQAWQRRLQRDPQIFERLKKWYPLGDFVTPEDIAEAAWFLASPQARMITGAVLAVDAGLTAGNPVMTAEITGASFG